MEELLAELEKAMNPQVCGKKKHSHSEGAHVNIWSCMMCLRKLPYWHKLKLRHNLDVMHIEKNICESLIVTILNVLGRQRTQLKLGLI
jgi:hypothetical protein